MTDQPQDKGKPRPSIHDMLDMLAQDMVPDDLKAKGWRYVDIPHRFIPSAWERLLSALGEGNYKLLAFSEIRTGDGNLVLRGQFLLNPAGQANLAEITLLDVLLWNKPQTEKPQ